MTTPFTDGCERVRDDLAALADDDAGAIDRHADHLSDCDECRDARHEARAWTSALSDAGEGWDPGDDLTSRIMAAVDAGLPSPPATRLAPAAPPRHVQDDAAATRIAPAPRRPLWRPALLVLALAAGVGGAIAVGGVLLSGAGPEPRAPAGTALSGRIESVSRAGAEAGVTGVAMRAAGAREATSVGAGQAVAPGSRVETDRRTRARLMLSDGSVVVLDHDTRIALDPAAPRSVHVEHGAIVADVAHLEAGPRATFSTPEGRLEVLGTKFMLESGQALTSVEVVRGAVRLGPRQGALGWAEVQAGQEGLVAARQKPRVMPSARVASAVRWSELEPSQEEATQSSGLGVLSARRPGEGRERAHPLSLALHKVSVRIAGNVARTEIEERFANDGPNVLEGTYEFPLPSDARIVRLALDVEGRLVEGAIVERDRAAKIWAGVIRHATPRAQRQEKEEFVWVPGPWRDPALLEWRSGGRFGLRIFPIPARGERRVILAYEQVLPAHGDGRRYVYPLPQPVGAAARAARFVLDARVTGADRTVPVRVRGYAATPRREGPVTHVGYAEDAFVPAGDFVIDWALPDREAELRAWSYGAPATGADGAGDLRGWALLAVRPTLPAWTESRRQDVAIVVDASQSMFGERFTRASELAAAVVAEMDRRDRFTVLACDAACVAMSGGARSPSAESASEARAWLAGIRPAGASDLVASLTGAARAFGDDRHVRVVYIGDGNATVGHRRAPAIEAAVAALADRASFTTVGVGGEADASLLSGVARAGGGQFVAYGPGDTRSAVALAVLETTMGPSLEQATLTLPPGLEEAAPALLPTIRAGEELVVAARLAGPVRGEAVLRGRVGGEPFERRYPLALDPTRDAGNAFVPAVWAERRIADLDREDGEGALERIVALSRKYRVVSRHTSLLVLESEAMFRAYGVDRDEPVASWSGDEEPIAAVAEGTGDGAEALRASRGGTRPRRSGAGARSAFEIATGEARGNAPLVPGHHGVRGLVAPSEVGGAAAMSGSLDRSGVQRVIGQHMGAIRNVFERSLRSNPNAGGRLVVTFTIQPDGSVGQVDARGGEDLPVQDIANVVRRMRFPPREDGPVTVSFPFVFQSAGAEDLARFGRAQAPVPRPTAQDPAPPPARVDDHSTSTPVVPRPQVVEPTGGRPRGGAGRWMRRSWVRRAQIGADAGARSAELRAVEEAELSVRERPDSRDRVEALARALARAGSIKRALEVTEKWLGRDPLDLDALLAFSDALARKGRRDDALRLLSGTVDLRPDDRALHERLAAAFERLGQSARACAHRVTIAELAPADEAARTAAARCEAGAGPTTLAAERAAGEVTLDATWEGAADLDLALVTPKGARLSVLGGRSGLSAVDAASPGQERLGLRFVPAGSYLVEVTRAAPGEGPVHGRVAIQALGIRRNLAFTLEGPRTPVARIEIRREAVLLPAF